MVEPGGSAGSGLPPEALQDVLAAVDRANSGDPNQVEVRGEVGPKELLRSRLVTERVRELWPDADAAALVAARAHHLRRWEHPRSAEPPGRAGYLRWRAAAKRAHAEAVAEILTALGADDGFVERVGRIVRKEGLGSDPAVQVHEDALCLVFLETQLDDLLEDLGPERASEVLGRTLSKMSTAGRRAALEVPLSAAGRRALEQASGAHGPGRRKESAS